MRVDSANRNFMMLLGVALAPYLALGLLCCGVLSVVGYGLATREISTGASMWLGMSAIAFATGSVVGAGRAAASLVRQWRATRELAQFVNARQIPSDAAVALAARRNSVPLTVIDAPEPFSFTYGLARPRVVMSSGLTGCVDARELDAVLAHERYHVRNYDPLKVMIARTVATAFFFLPVLRDLQARYLAGRELAADRRAIASCGRPPLVGVLYKVVAGPSASTLGAAAAMGGLELLDVRLTQLEQGCEPPVSTISRRSVVLTAIGFTVMMTGLIATVIAVSGPLGLVDGSGGFGLMSIASVIGCVVWPVLGLGLLSRWLAAKRS